MRKMIFAVTAALAALTAVPADAAGADNTKVAQVDVQIGPGGPDRAYRERRDDPDLSDGAGPGGVSARPGQHCREVSTTVEDDDGRTVTRREQRCD
jgi:hypothetical protein